MKKQLLIELLSALLILLFLYASVSKFLDFKHFTGEMLNQPLPRVLAPYLVWFIPVSEVFIALSLMIEHTRLAGFWASAILMGLFTLYTIVILLHFFSHIPCSCGGVIKKLTWPQHLVFNTFFLAFSLIGIFLQHKSSRNKQHTPFTI